MTRMEYRIQDSDDISVGSMIDSRGGGEYTLQIDEAECNLRVISMGSRGVEFTLDNEYHSVRYLSRSTSGIEMVIDGVRLRVEMHPGLDEVVYKNSGGRGEEGSEIALRSQIPGKVVSIDVAEGDSVQKGDRIAVLESMKMQVSIKSHKDGKVRSLKIRQGGSVAKNDTIAEID